MVVDTREETFALGETEKFQDADAARDGLQTGALVEAKDAREVHDAMRIGKQMAEDEIASDASEPRALIVALDACAGVLDEFAVFDAGGAGSFAGAAVEAFINVVDEGVGDTDVSLLDVDHLVDAAAGRIGFEIPEAVGRTGVEAQAAVDAAGVVFVDRSWAGDGRRGHVGDRYGG